MRQKLLIADDNRAITEVLKLNFELLGYEVEIAGDGEEAEKKFASFSPNLMILDVMMPKKNGFQVCHDIKADPELAKVPIVLLTAKNLKEDVYWGYDCGADAYVTKPYDPRQLELLVDQLIREAASGKKSTAWTGLPDAARVRAEHEARLDAGSPSLLMELSFPEKPCQAFKEVHGTPKFKDFLHRTAWLLYEVVRDATQAGFVGQSSDDSFLVSVLPEEASVVRDKSSSRIAGLLKSLYADEEVGRGFLLVKPSPEAGEEEVPLIEPLWREVPFEPE